MASFSGEMPALYPPTRTGFSIPENWHDHSKSKHEKEDCNKDKQEDGDHYKESEKDGQVRKRMEISLEVAVQDKAADVGGVGHELVCQKAVDLGDAALDARMEVVKLKFDLNEILRVQCMERFWMEVKVDWERAAIAGRSTSDSPFFNGCPPLLRSKLRVNDLAMTRTYDRVMDDPSVNEDLLAILHEVGLNGVLGFRSEQLKRKWAQQEEDIGACKAKKALLRGSLEEFLYPGGRQLRGEKSELQDDEEDDGKLCDLKRLDREILELADYKTAWKKNSKESYKWYYPYAHLSSREEYLARLVDCLAERAGARGTAAPTQSEVIGYMLLELLATSALSPSISCAPFPPP